MFPAFLTSSSHFYQSAEGGVAIHIAFMPERFRLRARDADLFSRHVLTTPARLALHAGETWFALEMYCIDHPFHVLPHQ